MRWVGYGLAAVLLATPAARGEDPPKKEPPKDAKAEPAKDEKKLSAKERYAALVKEFSTAQGKILAEARKAKGPEQDKLWDKYDEVPKQFAPRFLQLAVDHPDDPAATDALFWLVQNANGTPEHRAATEKVNALIADMPVKDLTARLARTRATLALVNAVLKRAEKDEKDPAAGDLVAWAALRGSSAAVDRMLEKYPDHKDVGQVVLSLGRQRNAPETKLKAILAGDYKPKVKAAANLALARGVAGRLDALTDQPAEADKVVAEAEKYFAAAVELYKDSPEQQEEARLEMKAVNIRPGKAAPEVKGPDLDGKEFKLSDYKGKVVLLDFWGHW